MENSFYRHAALLLTGVAFLSACKQQSQTEVDNGIQFDSIRVEKTYYLLGDTSNPNCDLQVKYVFPVNAANAEILQKIQTHFLLSYFGEGYETLSPEEAVKRYADQYIEDYKVLEENFQEEKTGTHNEAAHNKDAGELEHDGVNASWYSYYEYTSNEILYNKNNLLSFILNFENYTGGAHGSHSCKNYNIDLHSGELITEEELFIDNYQDELARLLVSKLAKINKVENDKELEDLGYFSIEEIYPNNNFTIDDNGITYYFNEYEIAAYVLGETSIPLDFAEIKHLLRPENPLSRLLGN